MPPAFFSSVVDTHYASLYRFALCLVSAEVAACELVQQTFSRWAQQTTPPGLASLSKIDLFARLYREYELTRTEAAAPAPALRAVDLAALSPRDALAALQTVAEEQRAPVSLFYLENMSGPQIAEVLNLPLSTVLAQLAQGKVRLHERLTAATQAGGTSAPAITKQTRASS
jgi:DNA-directed RNA polymerase specialized sigma24 family protein